MGVLKIAAVQASYVLMNRDATIDRVEELTAGAAQEGAQLVVFPEAFVPGTPIWIDTRPIWDGDDEWFAMLVANAVVIQSPAVDRLAMIAEKHSVWLVVGVQEREPTGSTIYNTILYFAPDGRLVNRHRKLVPTGSERTVWGMGDGSTLRVVDTQRGRIGGLICWENYMPLARFHLYAQGVDVWLAPTLAQGDGWIATMQHLARENRMFVVGVNPVLHVDQHPRRLPRPRAARPCQLRRGEWPVDRAWEHRDRRAQRCLACRAPAGGGRRRSSPSSTSPRWQPLAGSWTQPATTTDLTSSGCWSTRPAGRPPPQPGLPAPMTTRTPRPSLRGAPRTVAGMSVPYLRCW